MNDHKFSGLFLRWTLYLSIAAVLLLPIGIFAASVYHAVNGIEPDAFHLNLGGIISSVINAMLIFFLIYIALSASELYGSDDKGGLAMTAAMLLSCGTGGVCICLEESGMNSAMLIGYCFAVPGNVIGLVFFVEWFYGRYLKAV